ncbi:MAG TPA: type II secretion system F family protein [Microthrixaceae bacterium]|nr:type II secretion system F family protein [Microthrixaceae bacterium]
MTSHGTLVATRTPREARAFEHQLPELASGLARSVHSGATLRVAMEDVAAVMDRPAQVDLRAVLDRVERGWLLDDALVEWQRGARSAGLDLLVAACRLGHAEGGDLKAALEGVAAALLDRIEVADETRALTSQARTSAYVLAVLPALGAAGFSVLDPQVADVLFTSPAGLACLLVGVTLNLLGAWCLKRLVRTALR